MSVDLVLRRTAERPSMIAPPGGKPRLLLVDDSENHSWALRRAFENRGYDVRVASSAQQAHEAIREWQPTHAVIDLRLPGPSGLTLIPPLKSAYRGVRIVMLTGYASIATAVEAIKLGATHYLVKPVDAPTLEAAFCHEEGNPDVPASTRPLSVDRLEWEYIQRVLTEQNGNISGTARALGMHRKTLQRKLGKRPVAR